ncbi:hypothetical protein N7467_003709 [Penicillium canescens]|nr:hypothetical protein N7467_003709 [Penicillium canescens]
MDQQQSQSGPQGPGGRKFHIAHRRSPSELTPLMMEQLAIQQQIELLQQQQQQIAATHQQYVNMGLLQPQQLGQVQSFQPGASMGGVSPQVNAFQFPQQGQQQLGVPMNQQTQHSHRRNQSALPGLPMGPPPAPSSGASGYADYNQQGQNNNHKNENTNHGRGRGGPPGGGGHQRRHSLALPEAKKAAELAQQKRTASGFQFPAPAPGASGDTQSSSDDKPAASTSPAPQGLGFQRAGNIRAGGHGRSQSMAIGGNRGSISGRGAGGFQFPQAPETSSGQPDNQRRGSQPGHARSGSRNFEGNWRQPNNQNQGQDQQRPMGQQQGGFQPGHRSRGSMNQSMGSIGQFQYPPQQQPQLIQLPQGQVMMAPQMFGNQQLNPLQLAQLQALQQQNGQGMGLQASQHAPPQMSVQQQQQQQQRKTLFTPYLPQANLPALLSNGQLVAGVLRVNKKNRSDAYVTTDDLDADIFICGSKDRNRALEGDFVAIELLDVDEVWSQKKEKEEKKKRKDITDARSNSNAGNDKLGRADSTGDRQEVGPDGSIRRRGSLRQRPTQKKNDDVEVEGQSLLLCEEDEISDEQKPLYAGHVVAVIERVAGQMFSGTLGLLRPSSQATKEKQEAERQARDGAHGRSHHDRHQDKPKIVWFKPTDKRVPLIAIPTEQAPRDFVEKHQDYANRIFVASIKRWPITSLHPFGTLVEQLGEMGDLRVETDALLRDNNFGSDDFSDAVLKSIGWEDWSVSSEGDSLASRRDFREETIFTIDPVDSKALEDAFHVKKLADGKVEIGVHVADIAHFVKGNSLVDREAKKRGTAVYLVDRIMNMLPTRVSTELCSLVPGEDRLTVSVVFKANPTTGVIDEDVWIGKGVIKSAGRLDYDQVNAIVKGKSKESASGISADNIRLLNDTAGKFREARFGNRVSNVPVQRLLQQLDDENVPVEYNIFESTAAHELVEELSHQANFFVARKLASAMPDKAFLRRQFPPNPRRLTLFVERMNRLGFEMDPSSSGSLQSSLCKVQDVDLRKGMETLLAKAMQRAKYYVGGTSDEQRQHYMLNVPVYTHFTNPSRRYTDILVHRQLEAVLSEGSVEFTDDVESLNKTADLCNNKKDSALNAQEQSVHIEACRNMDRKSREIGGDLISEGIVLCVYESAFDVLIPEYGFEKRVHCDQLPLKKAEYRKDTRVLELYWEKGVPSSAYIPEDERPKPGNSRAAQAAAAAREAEAARERARERDEAMRKQTETGTMSADDVDALFDDDEDVDDVTEMAAGVSLNSADRSTQSMPPSPTRNGHHQQGPHRTRSDPKIASGANDAPENKLTNKEKYLSLFKLREVDGDFIQDVTEMTRVPIILKTDLSKSPPCLTVRSVNPYAL